MVTMNKRICRLIILIGFLPMYIITTAQEKPLGMEVDKWADKLSRDKTNEVNSLGALGQLLMGVDSLRAAGFLDSIEASAYAKGHYFRAYFNMTKADYLYARFAGYDKYKNRRSKELLPVKEQIMKLSSAALDAAYHMEKDLMIGWVSFYSARRMRNFGETGWAVMYSKNGVDLFEKDGYAVEPTVYTELAELLNQVREYDECIIYAKKGMAAWKINGYEDGYKDPHKSGIKVRTLNAMGIAFYKKNQHDSANNYYQQALHLAVEKKDTLWTGKVLGNIGRLLYAENKFDSACQLLRIDYKNSDADSIYDNAANALLWSARANLALGNKAIALTETRESIRLLGLWPNETYLRDAYYTLNQVFRAMGNYDSAFFYNDRYIALNDSLEKEVATSSLAISKAKINYEASRYNIQSLNKEKQAQVLTRNIIIAAILVLSLIIVLALNRQRLKEKLKTQRSEQEKLRMEQEVASAKDQLKMFTEHIIEKTNLIDKLESQIKGKEATAEQHAIMTELSRQTILTEEDWDKFRVLFDKIYPGFFIKLKEKFSDITLAEQRMAALTRLQLTPKQMASMLGISPNSVNKTRQRLRLRLKLESDSNLEESILSI
jgi:DNA-binding CsgD family transcriptional regulator/tetratricopeptide (TPR) repeat protein